MGASERFTVEVIGGKIVGERCGRGPGLILLHAGVADRRMWNGSVPFLAARHTVITYDRRGFGDTQSDDVAFSHVADLDAIIRRFGFSQVTLIGCSQGGRIAIDHTLSHPDLVSALVLVAPALCGDTATPPIPNRLQKLLDELEAAEQRGDLDEVNRIEAHLWLDGPLEPEGRVSSDARKLFLDMNGIALRKAPLSGAQVPYDASEWLGHIVVPTLVICGSMDFAHIQQRAAWIANALPNARLLNMKGCAHLPNLEKPQLFNSLVGQFLSTLPA